MNNTATEKGIFPEQNPDTESTWAKNIAAWNQYFKESIALFNCHMEIFISAISPNTFQKNQFPIPFVNTIIKSDRKIAIQYSGTEGIADDHLFFSD